MSGDSVDNYYFDNSLKALDGEIDGLIELELERQRKKIILIASESVCPRPVRECLGSVFTNIYAEGYPSTRMNKDDIEHLLDHKHQFSYLRRYSDNRYYKGTEFADLVESLAQKRAAALFATENIPPEDIYVNVQPLSGAPANNAVYTAFLEPGDRVLSMSLNCGGHLSHGSEGNRSGIYHEVFSYGLKKGERELNYGRIRKLALKHRPHLIIAGYSAYPWDIDWKELKDIADAVGPECILLADIAHTAAFVVAGILDNPLEYADVVMFTTHKAIAGPRGAVLLTKDPERAERIDRAVFPGEQGGPHINNIAGQAVCFRIASTPEFREYAEKVVENSRYFAEVCEELGMEIAYGGTETHLFLIDLKSFGKKNGYYVTGEIASRLLDQVGITLNKNTIAGDENSLHPTGIRIGTPWITQRGFTREQIRVVAEVIYDVLSHTEPFHYEGMDDELGRGKIPLEVLRRDRDKVESLLNEVHQMDTQLNSGYPYYLRNVSGGGTTPLLTIHEESEAEIGELHGWELPLGHIEDRDEALPSDPVLVDACCNRVLRLRGDEERLRPFLQQACTADMALDIGEGRRTFLLDAGGWAVDDIYVTRVHDERKGFATYVVETTPANGLKVREWLRGLADGYVIFDEEDMYAKVEGPVVVEDLVTDREEDVRRTCLLVVGEKEGAAGGRDWFRDIGGGRGEADADTGRIAFEYSTESGGGGGMLHMLHIYVHPEKAGELWEHILREAGALRSSGYRSVRKVREGGGLPEYDIKVAGKELYERLPEYFALSKPYFVGEKKILSGLSFAEERKEWNWGGGETELRRTPLYEEHVGLGGRMVPFAGWEMPVQYEGIAGEHNAVRRTAGLFDVGHMGVLDFKGDSSVDLLDMLTTNYVRWIDPGETQYSYIFDIDGNVLDDIFIYRLARDHFMMVVNAANAEKIWDWVNAVNGGEYLISRKNPLLEVPSGVRIRNLKHPSSGEDMRMDLALQGPQSLNILPELCEDDFARELRGLKKTDFIRGELGGVDVIVARTGYTGEDKGFELFVHPDNAAALWRALLEGGEEHGIRPAGLGARDSLRTEAGFPLYGHEIEGAFGVFPLENGYAQFVKLHKPFFIGRDRALEYAEGTEKVIVRFRMNDTKIRMLHRGDPVTNRRGQCIGHVTSSVVVGDRQIGLAYVKRRHAREGATINIFPLPQRRGPPKTVPWEEWDIGDRTIVSEMGTILPRFPEEDEMLERAGDG